MLRKGGSMRRVKLSAAILVAGFAVLVLPGPTLAVITRLTSLADMTSEASFVLTAKVETLDSTRPSMMLAVEDMIKGKPGWKKMPVLLTGDKRAEKLKEQPQLLKRLA